MLNQDLEAEWGLSMFEKVRAGGTMSNITFILLSQTSVRLSPRMKNTDENTVYFPKPIAI